MLIRSGLGGFGDSPADRYPQLYARLRLERGKLAAKVIKSLSGSIPFTTYAQIMREQASNAAANVREIRSIGALDSKQRTEIAQIAQQLAHLATAAEAQATRTPTGRITPNTARRLVEQLQRWLTGVAETGIAQHDAVVGAVARAPRQAKKVAKEAVQKALELPADLFKGLGFPSWALPVGLTLAGLLIAAPYVAPLIKGANR